MAELESASIDSFAILARELADLGAPSELVTAANAAARDEHRHTWQMVRLATRFGGTAILPEIAHGPTRTKFDIALENAVEGCVRESFGAVVAFHQAEHATDAGVRRTMAKVAEDEARHAELAWRVAAWIEPSLTANERAQIEAARRRALRELAESARVAPSADLVETAGMPEAWVAARLVAAFASDVVTSPRAA